MKRVLLHLHRLPRSVIGILLLLLPLFAAQAQETPARRHELVIEHLKRTAAEISALALDGVNSLEDWQRQRPERRSELLYMLGLDPLPRRTPVEVQITGTLERPGYRIEKIVFQSLPGLYVTGNFYLPANASGRLPTVLYVCGHAPHPLGAKTEYQDRAAWFASNGYACLILDTLEFGEVAGLHHGIHDLNLWNWLSLGYTPAGVEVWNAMRAIDYLETRPEVDRLRIGMTGTSGGGATTWFTAAVDERVAVAVPVVSTYTFGSQAAHWVAAGQCDCIYFHNTFLTDFPVVCALIAPRPLLILSGQRDGDFPPDGYHEAYRRAKRIYDIYAGKGSERIREVDDDIGHSDPPHFRREARQWMGRWLKSDIAPVADEPAAGWQKEQAEELACLVKLPRDAINYQVQNLFTSPIQLPQSSTEARPQPEELIAQLKEKVFRWFPLERIPFETKVSTSKGGWASRYADYKEVEFNSEAGVRIRAQLLRPKGQAEAPLLIYIKRAGDSIYSMDLDELLPLLGRYAVLILNPRLTEHPVSAFEYAEIERSASWVGRTVAAMQVWDLLRAIEWAVGEEKIAAPSIALYGKGDMGVLALYAGLFDERITQVILNDAPSSHWQRPALLNVLRITDIAEVAGAFAPRRLASLTEFPRSFDYTRDVYGLRGAASQLVRAESLPEALKIWNHTVTRGSKVALQPRHSVPPRQPVEATARKTAGMLTVAHSGLASRYPEDGKDPAALFSDKFRSSTPSDQTVLHGENPSLSQDSLKKFTVAEGLEIELVAAEPDVRQPVCINFDERGRLWVVQYLQYPLPAGLKILRHDEHMRAVFDKVPEPPPNHTPGADKVTIFEDKDGDGLFETHKDFITGLNIATSALPGRGGVYVMNPPYLLFYPDHNRDDVPDGDPEVLLAGFGLEDTHAAANSLTWGPDGWLYGAQGSTCTATIRGQKIYGQFSWRFHPATHEFEVFAEGAGNTFCLEFDRKGRLYSGTNHANRRGSYYVQGGFYERVFSKHGPFVNPFTYGYFPHMKHQGDEDRFSHSLIVYEGGAWPEQFNGKLISLVPLHNRVQISSLLPDGSTFKTSDTERAVETTDKWFRPVDIKAGPDGAVYFADWYDIRLTHADPRDNWDRSNGRIYRLKAKDAAPAKTFDLAQRSDDELLQNLSSPGKWLRQQSLRVLGDRHDTTLVPKLAKLIEENTGQLALEALWVLNLSGGFNEDVASPTLNHVDPFVRLWTVRLQGDAKKVSPGIQKKLVELARTEKEVHVRSQLACSARRLSASDALPIIQELAQHSEDIKDPHLPLLLWWAVEDKAISDRALVLATFSSTAHWKTPLLAEHLLPRLVQRYAAEGKEPDLEAAAQLLRNAPSKADRQKLLAAFGEGCKGRKLDRIPPSLREVLDNAGDRGDPQMVLLRLNLGVQQPADLETALNIVRDDDESAQARRSDFIKALGQSGQSDAVPVLLDVLRTSRQHSIQHEVLSALQLFDEPQIGRELLAAYPRLPKDQGVRSLALDILSKRKVWANELARAVAAKTVSQSDIKPELVERLKLHHDTELDRNIQNLWGATRLSPEEKQQRMATVAKILASGKGDSVRGKALYTIACGKCHLLFGEGQKMGPDLTGYERDNLDFILVATIDPSAGIREEYTNYQIETTDGLLLSGYILEQTPQSVTIEDGQQSKVVVPRDEIETLRASPISRMPDGLLDAMSDEQVRDLFAYLQSKGPVANR